jgi:hypothetical protein
MAKDNGGIIGVLNTPTSTSASGVWQLMSEYQARLSGTWPAPFNVGSSSARFNSGSSDYLNKTSFGTATNRKIFTFSFWVKKVNNGDKMIFSAGTNSSTNVDQIYFRYPSDITENTFDLLFYESSVTKLQLRTTQYFRDPSAWYHFVVAIDSTQATSTNRAKVYLNGSQVTSFSTATYPSLNDEFLINSTGAHYIAGNLGASATLDGYLADYYFIDGQALTPSSFGQTDSTTGIWIPKAYTGTYGTNGFYLNFSNASSLGTDASGNGNNFTVNNLTSADQSKDHPTNNWATLNSLNVPASNQPTFSNGNLASTSSTAVGGSFGGSSNFSVSTGKWYIEAKAGAIVSSNVMNIGVTYDAAETARTNNDAKTSYEYTYNGSNGYKSNNNTDTAYGSSYTTGDIIGIALDLDNNKLYFAKNGVWQNSGVPTSGATGTGAAFTVTSNQDYSFYQQDETGASANTSSFEFNFGQPPYSVSGGYSDGNGYGNFTYQPPSGYLALCTNNLASNG